LSPFHRQEFTTPHGFMGRRCERCLSALPNGRTWGLCPVCGSSELSYEKTASNERDGWDADWQYTPQRVNGKVFYG